MYPILDMNRTSEPTSIHDAAERGNNMAIESFIAKGSTVDKKDHLGRTPIMWAIENGHQHTVEFLMSKYVSCRVPPPSLSPSCIYVNRDHLLSHPLACH